MTAPPGPRLPCPPHLEAALRQVAKDGLGKVLVVVMVWDEAGFTVHTFFDGDIPQEMRTILYRQLGGALKDTDPDNWPEALSTPPVS